MHKLGNAAASEKGQKRILSQSLQKGKQHYLCLALGLVSPTWTPDFQNWEGAVRDLLEPPQETNRRCRRGVESGRLQRGRSGDNLLQTASSVF